MESAERFSAEVGQRVKAARALQGRSLTELAASAGIGKGSLSEIEAGRRNPTLATLYVLADALSLPLSHLLPGPSVGEGPQGETFPGTPFAEVASPGITARLLNTITIDAEEGATVEEVFSLTLTSGQHRLSTAHPLGTTEHLYLTAGEAEVGPVGALQVLATGESLRFRADVEHSYRAITSTARAVLTILTPLPRHRIA